MTALMSRSQSVMDRLPSPNQDAEKSVTFVIADEDTGAIRRTVILSFSDWEAFGSPDCLTVVVEPGDHLNQAAEL